MINGDENDDDDHHHIADADDNDDDSDDADDDDDIDDDDDDDDDGDDDDVDDDDVFSIDAAEARSTAGPGSPLTALTSARQAPCVFHRRYWETHLHHRACSQPARRLHRLRQRGEGCCLSNNHARRNSEHLVQPVHELLATDPTVVDFCIYDASALAEEDAGDIRARPSANARQSTNARETSPTVLPFILARLALTS